MVFAGNVIWFVFGFGWLLGTCWLIGALVCCLTIVGIPFGIACFRIARFAYFPFGKDLVDAELIGEKRITGTGILNFIWCILFGVWMSIVYAFIGLLECSSLIGIPFGLASFKLCKAAFAPLGKRVVSSELAKAAREHNVKTILDEKLSNKGE